jgi:hypothetical protein
MGCNEAGKKRPVDEPGLTDASYLLRWSRYFLPQGEELIQCSD